MRCLALAAIAALSLSSMTAVAAPSAAGRTEFEVLRNGQPFGRHVITVSAAGGGYTTESRVSLRAGAGPVTLFRYEQDCSERWSGGALSNLSCSTLRDGRRTLVTAARDGEVLRVTSASGVVALPASVFPTSWWTKPPTDASYMLNTENGARMPLRVTRIGRETIDAGGARIDADHIRVQGTLTVDLWYDQSGRWVGCAFTARGQRITYRLASPLAAAPA